MFIDKPHRCNVPVICHGAKGKVGAWYECDRCKAEWQVQSRSMSDVEGFYHLTWIRRVGDYTYTISWKDML